MVPIDGVIYLGESQSGAIQNCLSEYSKHVYFLCHGEAASKEKLNRDFTSSSYLHPILCSDHDGVKAYYQASLASESGTIDPTILKSFWKNIRIKSESERKVTTLDTYIAKSKNIGFQIRKINWMVIDMLAVVEIISGAQNLLQYVECLVVKFLCNDDVSPELTRRTQKYLTSELESQDFILIECIKSTNPHIGYGIYLKDWKKIHARLVDVQSKSDRDYKEVVTSLAALDDAHNALKDERDSLEQSHREAVASSIALKTKIETLTTSQKAFEVLVNEFDAVSQNLRETTQSLKLSTQLHIKKEIDYKDLKEKYSNLLEMTQEASPNKKIKIKHKNSIRILHHLSCTGGTLIAKCLAAQPNVLLLNEVDPLSTILLKTKKAEFTPTDLIGLLRQADNNISSKLLENVFRGGLRPVLEYLDNQGLTLVGRDHSHGKYLTGDKITNRASFKEIVSIEHKTISLVSVRHPIDSFLSLQSNEWDKHFSPSTLDEYCRRYMSFLDDMQGSEIFRYEDFVENPKGVMRKMCLAFKISYDDDFIDIFEAFTFSGASGRSNPKIEKRARRDISHELMKEIDNSVSYHSLIKRLNY